MGLRCQYLGKTYQTRGGSIAALRDVNLDVGDGEFICLVGPSGCGKTTFLKLIAGLLQPTVGQITFNGRDRHALGGPQAVLVFQEHGLFPWMSVLDNVAFGLEMQGMGRLERHERAHTFISKVGLAQFARCYPHELSMGMRQRVAIARAFLTGAPILLMDEPFGSLDAQTRLVLQGELLNLWREQQKLIVYVTHDIEEAVLLGDRVLVMTGRPGTIREDIRVPLGRPRDLSGREQPQLAELEWHIWTMLRDEVRKSLWIPE